MFVINARNVNDAYRSGILYMRQFAHAPEPSRAGLVYRSPVPVTTVYRRPWERVLFDAKRNANPFFHLMEALWMLGGRSDVAWLAQYSKQAAGMILGESSYGYRWRQYFQVDQLSVAINKLRKNINDRRVYVGMWNPHRDLTDNIIDVPCNLGVKFFGREEKADDGQIMRILDMIVFNRSNDMIWGCYGANAVHMSFLHEYVAICSGCMMGTYTQVSADFHCYVDTWTKHECDTHTPAVATEYSSPGIAHVPLLADPVTWDTELALFLEEPQLKKLRDPFLNHVAIPMREAWAAHKDGKDGTAMAHVQAIVAEDWRKACVAYLSKLQTAKAKS